MFIYEGDFLLFASRRGDPNLHCLHIAGRNFLSTNYSIIILEHFTPILIWIKTYKDDFIVDFLTRIYQRKGKTELYAFYMFGNQFKESI